MATGGIRLNKGEIVMIKYGIRLNKGEIAVIQYGIRGVNKGEIVMIKYGYRWDKGFSWSCSSDSRRICGRLLACIWVNSLATGCEWGLFPPHYSICHYLPIQMV
jgi:hypothetical protein